MTEEPKITQADRDAAAQFVALLPYEEHPLVLAFASHRQQSTAELLEALREVQEAIRELRLADGHAARTGDESRFDRALPAICQHENRIKVLLAKHGAQS